MSAILNNPRVGYVLKAYPRFSETFILNEILAHERAGMELEIFSLRPSTESCFHEALARVQSPVTYLDRGSTRPERFWETIRSAGRELPRLWQTLQSHASRDPEEIEQAVELANASLARGICHLHAHFGTTAASVAQLAASFAGIEYSFTAHAKDIFHEDVDVEQLNDKCVGASQVVTVSKFNLRYLRREFPGSTEKFKLIYNGLDLNSFSFMANQQRKPLILAVGRLVEKKGFEYLIDSCALLRDLGGEFRCEIIGHGRMQDFLADRIRENELDSHVRLLGSLSQQSVRDKLAEASLLVAPCVIAPDADRDGLPTVLLEAMAVGTPCVSTDVTGIPEILRDGETGLLVPQRNAQQLATAIQQLIDDVDLRRKLARNARRLVEQRFDIDINSAALREVFSRTSRQFEQRRAS